MKKLKDYLWILYILIPFAGILAFVKWGLPFLIKQFNLSNFFTKVTTTANDEKVTAEIDKQADETANTVSNGFEGQQLGDQLYAVFNTMKNALSGIDQDQVVNMVNSTTTVGDWNALKKGFGVRFSLSFVDGLWWNCTLIQWLNSGLIDDSHLNQIFQHLSDIGIDNGDLSQFRTFNGTGAGGSW